MGRRARQTSAALQRVGEAQSHSPRPRQDVIVSLVRYSNMSASISGASERMVAMSLLRNPRLARVPLVSQGGQWTHFGTSESLVMCLTNDFL